MKNNEINTRDDLNYRPYKEYDSGWADSVVYTTDRVWYPDGSNPRFYKFYRSNISRGMLEMYHHIHHYLSQKDIPICPIPGQYKDDEINWKWKWIKFEVLDLDPEDIRLACNWKKTSMHK